MNKFLFCIAFLLTTFLAVANPLFYRIVKTKLKTDRYEYFYDSYGNLIGREDVGEAGCVYSFNGEDFEEDGNFVYENGWCLYYDSMSQKYLGKASFSAEDYRDYHDDYHTRYRDTYVDAKNRPVATFTGTETNEALGSMLDYVQDMLNPIETIERALSFSGSAKRTRIFMRLQGEVRWYYD